MIKFEFGLNNEADFNFLNPSTLNQWAMFFVYGILVAGLLAPLIYRYTGGSFTYSDLCVFWLLSCLTGCIPKKVKDND